MKLLKNLLLLLFLLSTFFVNAQKIYTLDASKPTSEIKTGHLKMGNPGPAGHEFQVNSWYMTLAGKPIPTDNRLRWKKTKTKPAIGTSILTFRMIFRQPLANLESCPVVSRAQKSALFPECFWRPLCSNLPGFPGEKEWIGRPELRGSGEWKFGIFVCGQLSAPLQTA